MYKKIDFHTHLFPPSWKNLCESGLVAILDYHYLHAELLRVAYLDPEEFLNMSKQNRAELIWNELILRNTKFLSTAVRGVKLILSSLGISDQLDFEKALSLFEELVQTQGYDAKIFELAGLDAVVMTNDIFDQEELSSLLIPFDTERYICSFRLDAVFQSENMDLSLHYMGNVFKIGSDEDLISFMGKIILGNNPVYLALSLNSSCFENKWFVERLDSVIEFCKSNSIGISLMCGVKRRINPTIGLAGDGEERFNLGLLHNYLRSYPEVRFFITVLNLNDQYSLCVLARKFRNVIPFGIWWFQNHIPQIRAITNMRINMLGNTFIPQHSDARVLEHLIYKWDDTRQALGQLDESREDVEKFMLNNKRFL